MSEAWKRVYAVMYMPGVGGSRNCILVMEMGRRLGSSHL